MANFNDRASIEAEAQRLADEYNNALKGGFDIFKRDKMLRYRSDVMEQAKDPNNLLANAIKSKLKTDFLDNTADFFRSANKTFYGDTTRNIVKSANLVGSGFNDEQATKKTNSFLNDLKQSNSKLVRGANPNSEASMWGQAVGQSLNTGRDLALIAVPGVGATNVIAKSNLLNKGIQGTNLGAKVKRGLVANVGGGVVSSAVAQGLNPEQSIAENFGYGAAVDAGLSLLGPVVGSAARAIRNPVTRQQASQAAKTAVEATTQPVKYAAKQDPRVMGFDDQYNQLARQFDNLPAGSPERSAVSRAMAQNRQARLGAMRNVEREIGQGGYIRVPGSNDTYYHGTNKSFDKFDPASAGSSNLYSFVTKDKNLADKYANQVVDAVGGTKTLIPAKTSGDFFSFSRGNPAADEALARELKEFAASRGTGKDERIASNIAGYIEVGWQVDPVILRTNKTFQDFLRSKGYSGYEVVDGNGSTFRGVMNDKVSVAGTKNSVDGQRLRNNTVPTQSLDQTTQPSRKETPLNQSAKQSIEQKPTNSGYNAAQTSEVPLIRAQSERVPLSVETPQEASPLDRGLLLPQGSVVRSSADSIPLQLTPGQAKQRFRKLNRDGTPFEVVNDLDKNAKTPKTNIVDEGGNVTKGGIEDTPTLDFSKFKDRPALMLNRETLERNIESVAGKDADRLKQYLVDASRKNETDRIKFIDAARKDVKENVVKKLGIKGGSTRSKLVQQFGEGEISLAELKRIAPNDWRMVQKGSEYFRKQYDDLLDRWNAQRQKYGYDPIPKRKDYFRHFTALDNAISIVGTLKNAKDLPTSISGITDIFKPNTPFTNAALARTGNKTTYDAVAGFDNYIESISKQIFHTDTIQRGRAVVNNIRKTAEIDESKAQLPNFVASLDEWTNLVAGKKSRIDRAAEALVGRKVFAGANLIQRQVSRNMIGYNLGSALTSAIPLTQSLATTEKLPALKGLTSTLIAPFKKGSLRNIDGVESSFLVRRFPSETLTRGAVDAAIKAGYAPMKAMDMFASRTIVSGKYFENLAKGMDKKAAMKAADEYAGRVITDRSNGQMPNLFKAQTPSAVTQFMAEVNNQLSFVLKDMPKQYKGDPAKIAWSAAQMAVYAYMFNEAFESVTGRRVAVDPIDFVKDMVDPDKSEEQKWESLRQNILSAVPGSGFFFESGRLPISAAAPDGGAIANSVESFGEGDIEKGVNQLAKGFRGPAAYLLPPTGGGQAMKMADTAFNQAKGYSETPGGQVRFQAPSDPLNIGKSLVFGQYATDQGKQYIDNGISALSENQSKVFKDLPEDQRQSYIDVVKGKSEKGSSQAVAELEKANKEAKAKFEASFSPEDYQLYSLSKENRKKLIDQGVVDAQKFKGLDAYANAKKKELGMNVSGGIGDTKLSENTGSYKFLNSKPEMTDEEEATWKKQVIADSDKGMIDAFNKSLPDGLPKFEGDFATNEIAELYAKYQKDKADKGWSELQAKREGKKLFADAYKSIMNDEEKYISSIPDKEIISAIQNGEIGKESMDNVIGIDNILVQLGLTPMISNSTRRKLGYNTVSTGSGGSGGSGGFTKQIEQLASINNLGTSTASDLLTLLGNTTVKGKTSAPSPQKVALKKVTVKG